MIRSLKLTNFKCFEEQTFSFGPLTLLSGINSTGKSSVLQALLLLRQSNQQGLLKKTGLALNGDWVNIGTAKDVLYEGAKKDLIEFSLLTDKDNSESWSFSRPDSTSNVLPLQNCENSNKLQSALFNEEFHYLQAERVGPRTAFAIDDYHVRTQRQLGTKGEYTAYFLHCFGHENIDERMGYSGAASLKLSTQVEAWLGEISPGTQLRLKAEEDLDLVRLRYIHKQQHDVPTDFRASNVGFGITYILPVLVAVLSSSPGALVLLENPEAHIHPRGQREIGRFLALAASCGIQIILETHSDHILNGVRLAVLHGELTPEDVRLHYFSWQEEKAQKVLKVDSPKIDKKGRIDYWPEGFFDAWDKSLEELLEI